MESNIPTTTLPDQPRGRWATASLTNAGCIILIRQYRHPVHQIIYDLPARHLEPGKDPIQDAGREFDEETGYFPAI